MEIINWKSTNQTFCTYCFIFVKYKNDFIWCI